MKMMRGSAASSPAQYATPRREGAPPWTVWLQSSVPVDGSSATTRSTAGTYITPSITIGVACEFGSRGSAAPSFLSEYVQAEASWPTLSGVTSASDE